MLLLDGKYKTLCQSFLFHNLPAFFCSQFSAPMLFRVYLLYFVSPRGNSCGADWSSTSSLFLSTFIHMMIFVWGGWCFSSFPRCMSLKFYNCFCFLLLQHKAVILPSVNSVAIALLSSISLVSQNHLHICIS